MGLPSFYHNYFSSIPDRERTCRRLYWAALLALTAVLFFFWYPLRSTGFTYSLASLTITHRPLAFFFRGVTTLGSEGFFLILFSLIYWGFSKSLGFWGLTVMALSIFLTSEVPKDIIRLPRPGIPGVAVPTYTFPSGHTSGAVSVWGYLAVVLKRRWLWIWSLSVIFLVGLSRVLLGYHFPGDVLGGIATGMLFLALFCGLWFRVTSAGLKRRLHPAVLLVASLVLPLSVSFVPVFYAPRLMGYLAGTCLGYLLEGERLGFDPVCGWRERLLRGVIGLAGLGLILLGLDPLIPAGTALLDFARNALATLWVTYLAPGLFMRMRPT